MQLTHDDVFHQATTLWRCSQVPFVSGSLRWERGVTLSEDHWEHLWIGWVVRYTGRMLTSKIPPSHGDGFWGVCNSRNCGSKWSILMAWQDFALASFFLLQEHTKNAAERGEELLVAPICGKKWHFDTIDGLPICTDYQHCVNWPYNKWSVTLPLMWLLRRLRDNDMSWGYCWVWVPVESGLHCKIVTQTIPGRALCGLYDIGNEILTLSEHFQSRRSSKMLRNNVFSEYPTKIWDTWM